MPSSGLIARIKGGIFYNCNFRRGTSTIYTLQVTRQSSEPGIYRVIAQRKYSSIALKLLRSR
jgi:hypothetical protein